jgi:hypothetical protein
VNASTPITEMASCSVLDATKMFTTLARMMPTKPMNKNDPKRDRSRPVQYPNGLMAACRGEVHALDPETQEQHGCKGGQHDQPDQRRAGDLLVEDVGDGDDGDKPRVS